MAAACEIGVMAYGRKYQWHIISMAKMVWQQSGVKQSMRRRKAAAGVVSAAIEKRKKAKAYGNNRSGEKMASNMATNGESGISGMA